MFYMDRDLDPTLRFGDVIRGVVTVYPSIKSETDYTLDVSSPNYSVVMSPCCSIEQGEISISPLICLKDNFTKNPYFSENFLVINQKIPPEKHVPKERWDQLPETDKTNKMALGPSYALKDFFIYDENEHFDEYTLKRLSSPLRFYMINFKNIYKVKCHLFNRGVEYPNKVLQLSIDSRTALRDKISDYFSRIPNEDK